MSIERKREEERLITQLSLEPNEEDILIWALQGAISDLGGEIADTENQEFREDLRSHFKTLRSVMSAQPR